MTEPAFYYFGCEHSPGHFLQSASGKKLYDPVDPWGWKIDGGLCPPGRQFEGTVALHHKDGWTAIAFWDRSVDSRGGSNSVFMADQILPYDQMIEAAKAKFPAIWSRFKFEVTNASKKAAA